MKIATMQQRSPEWYALKKGRIGGTRFGQVISGRKNKLIHELLDERLSDFLFPDDYTSEEMEFGIDNEPIARQLYSDQTGIPFEEVGAILSDYSDIHLHSPDGLNQSLGIVLEVKCTMDGSIHIQRFFDGPEDKYMPQIYNAFAVSDEVNAVHLISYCPSRTERPIISWIFTRDHAEPYVTNGRAKIRLIEQQLIENESKFKF